MPPKRKRIKRKKKTHRIILVLLLIAAGIFLLIREPGKEDVNKSRDVFKPEKRPEVSLPALPPSKKFPEVAIVIDDMGRSRKMAEKILNINSPVTLSILPGRRYSVWIAEQGNRLGHDIIVHLPMEATRPLKLGEGGLYTWMSDDEIVKTLEKDIRSVPFIKGASNHMGSAFTQDERAMRIVILTLKKRGLFFLDSFTISKSVGFKLAKAEGLRTLRRDIFLDNKDDPVEIERQWKKLLKISKKRGHAIAVGHPRKNTIEFLQKVLENNKEVRVVPVTELIVD